MARHTPMSPWLVLGAVVLVTLLLGWMAWWFRPAPPPETVEATPTLVVVVLPTIGPPSPISSPPPTILLPEPILMTPSVTPIPPLVLVETPTPTITPTPIFTPPSARTPVQKG